MPEVIEGTCPGADDYAGCYVGADNALADGRFFEHGAVFVYSLHDRFTLMHELGHAFDDTMMDSRERDRFLRFTHQRRLYWTWNSIQPDGAVVQFNTPAEQFADAYANCRLQHEPGRTVWEAGYDYYPTPKQHRRICAMIARAGEDPGAPLTYDGTGSY